MDISRLEARANKGLDAGLSNTDLRELVGYVKKLENKNRALVQQNETSKENRMARVEKLENTL